MKSPACIEKMLRDSVIAQLSIKDSGGTDADPSCERTNVLFLFSWFLETLGDKTAPNSETPSAV